MFPSVCVCGSALGAVGSAGVHRVPYTGVGAVPSLLFLAHIWETQLWQQALSAQGWLKDFSVGMRESWDARLQMGRSV